MKKSLLTVITFAICLVNLVLTAVLAIAIVPETKNVNALVTKVTSAIDLELEAAAAEANGSDVTIDKIYVYEFADPMTINLKKGEDGEDHFALIGITLSINTESETYQTYNSENLDTYLGLMQSEINSIISSYTIEEIRNDQSAAQEEIKDALNALFGSSDFIVSVGFYSATYQ